MILQIDCPPSYPPGFKLVFVGKAPGEEEVKERSGFAGASGKCLARACSVAGLDWSSCAKTNVAKRRSPDNKFRDCFYEIIEEPIYTKTGKLSKKTKKVERKTQELQEWEYALQIELKEQNPNLVVACGNEAMEAIIGLKGITDYRGSIILDKWGNGHKVLAVEHPSFIIRGNPERFWILARDLQKAKREMEFPEIRREPYNAFTKPDKDYIFYALNWLRNNPQVKWTLDIETRAGTLACFAIAWRGLPIRLQNETIQDYISVCIPIQTTSGPYWTVEEELEIWRTLRATTLANPNLCNQNIEYDLYYLLHYGVEPSGIWMDTMLAHSILYQEFPKDLGFLGSFYLDDVAWWKDDHREWSGRTPDEALWEYCCKDAVYTLRIVEKIDKELKRRGLFKAYHGENRL